MNLDKKIEEIADKIMRDIIVEVADCDANYKLIEKYIKQILKDFAEDVLNTCPESAGEKAWKKVKDNITNGIFLAENANATIVSDTLETILEYMQNLEEELKG